MCSSLEDSVLALVIAVCTLVSYLSSLRWWRLVPHLFYPEESKLEKQIAQLREEAERFNTTDQLHIHGKITRNVQLLMKQLALTRKQRCSLALCRKTDKTGTSAHQVSFFKHCCAISNYSLPTIIGLLISFGFMIPVLCMYGNRRAVVVVSHSFSHCWPSPMKWVDRVAMTVLLGPLLWSPASPGDVPDDAVEGSSGECLLTRGNNMSVSSSALSDIRGMDAAMMTVANTGENELNNLGLVSWFLVCYVAVRLSHRVFSHC
ncbi:hypothetical protein TraAM80_00630 [Trypanosoma rangeli]|uniref:Uncharacterized protein n=1 Tax=Trypanosoma rangeli TaxID=5698 RepID=A0A422P2P2_TRYRA|nr:uncharacterized protein TraAM80_00630 [Trypanosoma rangeli]RNF11935.1 hypothetical protein TraAM80_00630 [Trypanosoma rangeli]|eukprot:RNF11935.1 hypothetical protein TraAM80_00630 [Trypanosoma rangeli]